MSHIKFLSIPDSWTIKEFIDGVKRTFNWKNEERMIKLVHTESLGNGRKHLRLSFHDKEIMTRMMNAGSLTQDQQIRSAKINKVTILFQIMNNVIERFSISSTKQSNYDTNSSVIYINLPTYNDSKDIIYKLHNNDCKVEYVSFSKNNCFVKFSTSKECHKFMKVLKEQSYRYKIADTLLALNKFKHQKNLSNNEKRNTNNYVKQTNVKRKFENTNYSQQSEKDETFPKLYKTMTEISTNLAKIVEGQKDIQNSKNVDVSNNLVRKNNVMNPYDCNMNSIVEQYPNMATNFPLMLGMLRMRNLMNNSLFF